MSKYSIIVPTFNSEKYIRPCINSVLEQTYPRFELIILDGGSTEPQFLDWIRSLNDPRIKIFTFQKRLSIEENWLRILTLDKQEYMTILGHDDVFAPNYLETMDNLIQVYPGASLYQTHFNYINGNGNVIRPCVPMAQFYTPQEFLKNVFAEKIDMMATGFMMRSSEYEAVGGIPMYPRLLFADVDLWIKMVIKGGLAVSPINSFSFRYHQNTSAIYAGYAMTGQLKRFVGFLHDLKEKHPELAPVITNYSGLYLQKFRRSISHRLLRESWRERRPLTVKKFLKDCDKYMELLSPENKLASAVSGIRMALIIDSNILTRQLFFIFRKVYKKPLLKS